MPGFTTHYLFGQQTYQKLHTSDLKQIIQKHHTAFALGLQGPDIFFYDLSSLVTGQKNPGSIAHTANTGDFFMYLLESPEIFHTRRTCRGQVSPNPDETKKELEIAHAYILGFIGHYLLDTACHPYIYAISHYTSHPKGYMGHHIRLETDIDTTLLWFYQRRLPSEFRQDESIALSKEQLQVIAFLLCFTFSKAYPNLHLTRWRIIQAIRSMQKGTRLLYDPTGHKKALIRRIESIVPGYPILSPLVPSDMLVFHKDPCNSKHIPWQNPWNAEQVSIESFFDLFEKAQSEYSRILNDLADFFAEEHSKEETKKMLSLLRSSLGSRSYHSGLELS